jgi:Tfp pilus assembly protein PilO
VITARDRRIISALVPLLLIGIYWFMVLAPKRAESQKVTQELSKAQTSRDAAEQQVTQLNAAKASFASDYAAVIRLGKAAPTTLDMPSLLLQLDRAARGTGIEIDNFKPGTAAPGASSPGITAPPSSGASGSSSTPPSSSGSSSTSTPPGGGNNPAAPGAAPAQGFPAKQAQGAGNAVSQANGTEQGNADKANAVGSSGDATAGTSAPGLVSVPLTFTISGNYFGLSDFFHRMKRFVRVVNDQIVVRGRLMTVESFSFQKVDPAIKTLKADVMATIYLTPPDEGTTAGATPGGPSSSSGAASSTPAPAGSSTSSTTPTATATP